MTMRHEITRAGLLATDGTVQSGIYETCFAGSGIELITPSPEAQAAVMGLTYNGVKAGRLDFDTSGFEKAVRELFDNGAQTLILGCTELPPAAMASLPSAASRISKFFSNTLTRIARFSSESSAISSFLSSMKKHLLLAAQRRDSRLGRHGGADRAAGS